MQPLTVRALSALAFGLIFVGCSGNGSTAIATSGAVPDSLTHLTPSAPAAEYLYVSNAGSGTVSIFTINMTTGTLTGPSSVTAGSGPRGVAVGWDGNVSSSVYVVNNGSNSISAYAITGTTGALTSIPGSPFPAHGSAPNGVASIGKCVFTTNGGSSTVTAFYIKGSPHYGALKYKATYAAGTQPENIAIDPVTPYPFVYVTNEGSNTITAYKALPTDSCSLTTVGTYTSGGTGPFGVAVDTTHAILVVANLSSNSVSFSNIAGNGALTLAGTTPSALTHPVGVAISGGFAFVPFEVSGYVSAYNNTTRSLVGSYQTVNYPQGVAIDPLASFVYVANESSDSVSGYSIGTGGTLTTVGTAVPTGGNAPEYLATCGLVNGAGCEPAAL